MTEDRGIPEDITILIVEDDADLRSLYETYLAEYSVRTAQSGAEGLAQFDETIDVVLLDRRLPDQSGRDLLSAIREINETVPVAMLTAIQPDADLLEMPVDEYLVKPVDRDTVRRTVRVLSNRAQFEAESRAFFRLAAKQAALGTRAIDRPVMDELADRSARIEATLDHVVEHIAPSSTVTARVRPSEAEVWSLLEQIHDHPLPDPIRTIMERYQSLDIARPPFMWKWVHRLAPQNTLPCVKECYVNKVPIDKTLVILFITILDDLLETNENVAAFEALADIARGRDPPHDSIDEPVVEIGIEVWQLLAERLERAPRVDRYTRLFTHDLTQAVLAIEFSALVIDEPTLGTTSDLERYEVHNMVMLAYGDIDLMHAPQTVEDDLDVIREAIWVAQHMARIGNWISTWERELASGDFCSWPIIAALERGVITRDDLSDCQENPQAVDRVQTAVREAGIESELFQQWEQRYHELAGFRSQIDSFDLTPFVDGTEEVLRYHLASRGLK